MRWITKGRNIAIAGVALAAGLGFAMNSQAQTCTTDNWDGGLTGSPTVGKQDGSNRRYGGPCGMRVDLDGAAHYVSDTSPGNEAAYITRFYTFLDNAGSGPVTLFAAEDSSGDDVIQVVFENDAIVLSIKDQAGSWNDIPSGGVSVASGWHSVEFDWSAGASADIALIVDGGSDETATIDTSGIGISKAHLGNLNSAAGGGMIDFDDFDSRRQNRPGRLMVGDANDDLSINSQDFVTVINEISGSTFAAGQPDCNEDGAINSQDFVCVINVISGP